MGPLRQLAGGDDEKTKGGAAAVGVVAFLAQTLTESGQTKPGRDLGLGRRPELWDNGDGSSDSDYLGEGETATLPSQSTSLALPQIVAVTTAVPIVP